MTVYVHVYVHVRMTEYIMYVALQYYILQYICIVCMNTFSGQKWITFNSPRATLKMTVTPCMKTSSGLITATKNTT